MWIFLRILLFFIENLIYIYIFDRLLFFSIVLNFLCILLYQIRVWLKSLLFNRSGNFRVKFYINLLLIFVIIIYFIIIIFIFCQSYGSLCLFIIFQCLNFRFFLNFHFWICSHWTIEFACKRSLSQWGIRNIIINKFQLLNLIILMLRRRWIYIFFIIVQ